MLYRTDAWTGFLGKSSTQTCLAGKAGAGPRAQYEVGGVGCCCSSARVSDVNLTLYLEGTFVLGSGVLVRSVMLCTAESNIFPFHQEEPFQQCII
eukprot:979132-Pelagomonas_calceolata.AAC.5